MALYFMAHLLENWSLNEGIKFMQFYVTVELVVLKKNNRCHSRTRDGLPYLHLENTVISLKPIRVR